MASDEAEIMLDIIGRDGFIPLVDALSLCDDVCSVESAMAEIRGAFLTTGPDGFQAIMIRSEKKPHKIGDPLLKYP